MRSFSVSILAAALTTAFGIRARAETALAAPEVDHAATSSHATAQPSDYLFPGAGHASATMSTGVPFLAIGELAYGITDRFAVGAIGGITPSVVGVGVRPRFSLVQSGAWRAVLVVPTLYY